MPLNHTHNIWSQSQCCFSLSLSVSLHLCYLICSHSHYLPPTDLFYQNFNLKLLIPSILPGFVLSLSHIPEIAKANVSGAQGRGKKSPKTCPPPPTGDFSRERACGPHGTTGNGSVFQHDEEPSASSTGNAQTWKKSPSALQNF